MPRKDFAAFTRLDASDVNTYLMDQSVQTFAGTAARGSAITTPVEGMYTHLEDTDALQFWNGSAWRNPGGLTLIKTTSFTAQATVDITSVFTAEFDNYRIVVNANLATSAGATLRARLLAGATPITTNYASNLVNYNMSTAALQSVDSSTTEFILGQMPNTGGRSMTFDISLPFTTTATGVTGNYVGDRTAAYAGMGFHGGYQNTVASYNGIRFFPTTSSITGTIRIYGYRNA
jgi:hypothetical protein